VEPRSNGDPFSWSLPESLVNVKNAQELRPADEEDDGCGIGGRGIAYFLRVTDSRTKRAWNIPYSSICADEGEIEGEPRFRLGFICAHSLAWLKIVGTTEEKLFLDSIVLSIQAGTRKSLRSDGRRILEVLVEAAPGSYDPLGG